MQLTPLSRSRDSPAREHGSGWRKPIEIGIEIPVPIPKPIQLLYLDEWPGSAGFEQAELQSDPPLPVEQGEPVTQAVAVLHPTERNEARGAVHSVSPQRRPLLPAHRGGRRKGSVRRHRDCPRGSLISTRKVNDVLLFRRVPEQDREVPVPRLSFSAQAIYDSPLNTLRKNKSGKLSAR
jgi:hypothetical protein